jgi:glycosyltransferase involved in cell wall biosynthesis
MAGNAKGSMHHFAIDGNEANTAQRVGSNVFAFELLVALEALTRKNSEVEWTVLLSAPAVSDLPQERKGWTYQVVGPRPFWTQIGLPLHLFFHQRRYDAFFTPGHYAPRLSAVPYITSVMDLGFLKYPDQFRKKDYVQLKEWTRYSVRHADKVLAISEFTKKAVIKEYKRKADDVFVAYPSLPVVRETAETVPATWIKKELGVSAPYILYVGTLQPRKNIVALIKGFNDFSAAQKKNDAAHLVIAGKVGWLAEETLKEVEKSPFKDRIHLTGYVSDAQKTALYRKSLCTVLLGLYEGFGIPPLEAMAAGTLAVVANTSSLPEVVGDAGYLVPAQNTKALVEVFNEIIQLKPRARAAMLKKGRLQVKKFSWQTSAQTILDQLVGVAEAHGKHH